MANLTSSDRAALRDLYKRVADVLGPTWMRRVRRNAGPDRITVSPGSETVMMLDLNRFLVRVLNVLSRKSSADMSPPPMMQRHTAVYMGKMLKEISKKIKTKLSGPRPISQLMITSEEARIYFAALEWAHARWSVIRKNYVETAANIKMAEERATRMLWIVRSLINVGHAPVEKSRFLR